MVEGVNGLRMHVLEAGFDPPGRPCVLLLHGFPELAFSWRKVLQPLAQAGYHVVAPDQRGCGSTVGRNDDFDHNLDEFRILNLATDILSLVFALGDKRACSVIGHDVGASVAAFCALARPDVFHSVVLMSSPFGGPPRPLSGKHDLADESRPNLSQIDKALRKLRPPRKHYQWYYSTPAANSDMMNCPQGVHSFLRAYFHCKSADWKGNQPFPLNSWTAAEFAKLPTYYVMDVERNMPSTVEAMAPSSSETGSCTWMTEDELRVYSDAFAKTGFQGGLQWYRNKINGSSDADLLIYSERAVEVPALYISGEQDWGTFQQPGAFERMREIAFKDLRECHLIDHAGHWVQQEQHQRVNSILVEFLSQVIRMSPRCES